MALRLALLGLLVAAPLPFGSVEPWAVTGLELLCAGLGVWGTALLVRERRRLPGPLLPLLALGFLPSAIGLFQLLPLPRTLLGFFSPRALALREAVAAALPETRAAMWPLTLSPPDTLDAVLRYSAWALAGVAAAAAFRRRSHLRWAASALAGSACFQALYGSAEYLSGHEHIFGYAKRYYTGSATGTFINRNHFAEYLAIALPFALWLAIEPLEHAPRGSWKRRIVELAEGAWLKRATWFFAAGAIWAGVLLSASRGGFAAALAGSALFARSGTSRRLRGLALALLVPTAYLFWQEVEAPGERFFESVEPNVASFGGRLPVWQATLGIVQEFPLTGTGIGTFEPSFLLYRPPEVRNRWDHAHNDWLQGLAEGGPLTVAALGALFVVLWRAAGASSPFTGRPPMAASALLASVGAAMVHGLVDFGARIPAIGITLAVLVGLARSLLSSGGERRERASGARIATLSVLPLFVGLAAGVQAAASSREPVQPNTPLGFLGPGPRDLRKAADDRLQKAVAVLNDGALPAQARLRGYRAELREVERLLVSSLASNPAQPRAVARLAAVRFELDPPVSAEQAERLERLVRLASEMAARDADIQLLLGDLLFRMGRRSQGIPFLERAVALDPGSAGRAVGLLRENLASAEEIVRTLGSSIPVLIAARRAFEEDGLAADYVSRLEQRLSSPSPGLLASYGEACRRLGDPGRALEALGRLGPFEDPGLEAERMRQRALSLLSRGDRQQAAEEARAAARIQPDSASLQEFAGQVALAAGEGEEALGAFRRALHLAAQAGAGRPWRARLYREIGQAEEQAGRPDRAYDFYLKALELEPEEPHARKRVREMREAARPPRRSQPTS